MKKTALILIFVALISKIIGFSRDLFLSYFYGLSEITDAYFISNTIPSVLFSVIGLGLLTSFIPIYQKIKIEKGNKEANNFTNNILTMVFIISSVILVFSYIYVENLVNLIAPGFTDEVLEKGIIFTKINLFSIIFTGPTFIIIAYLNANNKFIGPSLRSIPLNLTIILFIYLSFLFSNSYFLPTGVLIAIIIQFLLLIYYMKKIKFSYSFTLDLKDKNIHSMFLMSFPIIISVSINQVNIIVDKSIASNLLLGGVSSLTYASSIYLVVDGVIITTLLSIVYPKLNNSFINNNNIYFVQLIRNSQRYFILMLYPITILLIFFSKDIVSILYGRGSFDESAIILTSNNLAFYAIGIFGFALRDLYSKSFYAMGNTKIPMINSSIALTLNIILNIILSSIFGIGGLALATSISGIIAAGLLGYSLHNKIKIFVFEKALLKSVFSIIFANICFLLTIYISDTYFFGSLIKVVSISISTILSFLIYIMILFTLNILDFSRTFQKLSEFYSRYYNKT